MWPDLPQAGKPMKITGTESNLIWRGKLQLGDQSVIYGDAHYIGLCAEFPIELLPFSGEDQGSGEVTVLLEAQEVRTYGDYEGHHVVVMGYGEDPKNSNRWKETELASARLSDKSNGRVEIPIRGEIPRYVSVRTRIDTEIPPGLYDEIVVRQLSILSKTHFGYPGFRPGRTRR
jgi:hypothetical protein